MVGARHLGAVQLAARAVVPGVARAPAVGKDLAAAAWDNWAHKQSGKPKEAARSTMSNVRAVSFSHGRSIFASPAPAPPAVTKLAKGLERG